MEACLPDGWEARRIIQMIQMVIHVIGVVEKELIRWYSDATNNPDGDGFDVNHNGILEPDEEFNNYLEYHIRDTSFIGQNDSDSSSLPFGIFTQLWQNTEDVAESVFTFGELISPLLSNSQNEQDKGSANPLLQIQMEMECLMVGRFGMQDGI